MYSAYCKDMDAVLGCSLMIDPGASHIDNGLSSDEDSRGFSQVFEVSCDSPAIEREDEAAPSQAPTQAAATKGDRFRKRKGKITQIMEALDQTADRLMAHDKESRNSSPTVELERERMAWKREVEQRSMDSENRRMEIELNKIEMEEKRTRENKTMMMQFMMQSQTGFIQPPIPSMASPHAFSTPVQSSNHTTVPTPTPTPPSPSQSYTTMPQSSSYTRYY
ncbi:hypothetical protein AOXY_G7603 [Acipenser oxyrinchus oxyrinchus]|uniref:Uncharacterized protein n=1 Tax=Acipenser oxyrinchus oxyrinchus TaxID=40147 RepID=A0AAD8GAA4_ACIOX|nr:hypothetical protein AOXY_G7603 [Acipenser oxyrinchus oxyrinchus]